MRAYNPQIAVPTLKAFVFGDTSTGKTNLLATAMDDVRTSPMLMLTCMGNPESIRRRVTLPFIGELEATSDLNPVYEYLVNGQLETHPFAGKLKEMGWDPQEHGPFKAIALDSATEYQRIALDEMTGNRSKRIGDDLKAPDRQMWGQALARLTRVARLLYGLPNMSVFITALEKRELEEATGAYSMRPGLWGQADGEVPSYSLLTMRLTKVSSIPVVATRKQLEGTYNIGYIDQQAQVLGGEKYGGLPKEIPGPTIPKIMDYIYGPVTATATK